MAIHFRDDDSSKVSAVFEGATLSLSGLAWETNSARNRRQRKMDTDAGVEDQNGHIWVDRLSDLDHLLEKL